jgi:hypothetical protein
MAVEAIHLYLVGDPGDRTQGRELKAGQPANDGAAAQVDAAALQAVAQMPDAYPFPQTLDDLEPDVPPVASARLENREG